MIDKDVKKTLEKISDITYEQRNILVEVKSNTEHNTELLSKHDKNLDQLIKQGAENTVNLRHHIERTDILQSRQYKVIVLLALAVGAGLIEFGPKLFKILGIFL